MLVTGEPCLNHCSSFSLEREAKAKAIKVNKAPRKKTSTEHKPFPQQKVVSALSLEVCKPKEAGHLSSLQLIPILQQIRALLRG